MFDFFDELFGEIKRGNYRYQVDGGNQIVLQGYKSLLKAENEQIVVKLSDGEMAIIGQDLRIKEFGGNTLIVVGTITNVSVDQHSKKKDKTSKGASHDQKK